MEINGDDELCQQEERGDNLSDDGDLIQQEAEDMETEKEDHNEENERDESGI